MLHSTFPLEPLNIFKDKPIIPYSLLTFLSFNEQSNKPNILSVLPVLIDLITIFLVIQGYIRNSRKARKHSKLLQSESG